MLGLYLHIPFCKSKCIYCDFYSLPHADTQFDAYCAALTAQLGRYAPLCHGETVDTVYFGGGTPSLLGPTRLCALLDAVIAGYAIAPDAEITLEANPDSARDTAALHDLHRAGFNRISLGMQSADDEILRRIGRIHRHTDTVQAVACARAAGFDNLSLDLIYGLPGQTREAFLADLTAAVCLAPEHLSVYGLKVEEGTPLYKNRDRYVLPDDDRQSDCYLAAVEYLAAHDYGQYEISNFCRPGRASRHNSRYWAQSPYLGFGPGAHSDFHGERFAVSRDLDAYLAGREVFSERSRPDARERESERIMLSLRTSAGIAAQSLSGNARTFLRQCCAHALAREEAGRFSLTPQGFLLSNRIIVEVLCASGL